MDVPVASRCLLASRRIEEGAKPAEPFKVKLQSAAPGER
jgi:hypothetical protein